MEHSKNQSLNQLEPNMATKLFLVVLLVCSAVKAGIYKDRFLIQYNKIVDPNNCYFSKDGVPYHSCETLLVESTDYGHETDSEAFR